MCVAGPSRASELTLARIFSDGAVLQRGMVVPVWGGAAPGTEVTVSFGGQEKTAMTDAKGHWMVELDSLKASAESRKLTISSAEDTLTISDVLVGEIWLCSGQSNMQSMMYPFADDPTKDPHYGNPKKKYRGLFASLYKKEVEENEDLPFRQFTVDVTPVPFEPSRTIPSKKGWYKVTPGQTEFFTQVGYFFGRELRRDLDVPVGIINASRGGSTVEVWMPKTAYASVPGGMVYSDKNEDSLRTRAATWERKKAAETLSEKEMAAGSPAENGYIASSLYNGMIAPLMPYAIRGAIWYQGESNVGGRNETYLDSFVAMVEQWRKSWGQEKLYFFWTQLAHHKEPTEVPLETDPKAELFYQQFQAMALLPDAGMSVANDIGHHLTIHPPNKLDIGRRLSRWALNKTYGRDIVPSGPIFREAVMKEGKVTLTFDCAGSGLMVARKSIGDDPAVVVDEPLGHFQICGADREWTWAEARITGKDAVEVWHPEIQDPVEVRYAWSGNPEAANLYNKEGLPTSLFKVELQKNQSAPAIPLPPEAL
jgi:sialate O-acetylesterase